MHSELIWVNSEIGKNHIFGSSAEVLISIVGKSQCVLPSISVLLVKSEKKKKVERREFLLEDFPQISVHRILCSFPRTSAKSSSITTETGYSLPSRFKDNLTLIRLDFVGGLLLCASRRPFRFISGHVTIIIIAALIRMQ